MKQLFYALAVAALILLLAPKAQADRLETWRFDPVQNRLEFTTDSGVQPKAQLVYNPTRLVVDLVGIDFDRPALTQMISNSRGFRALRIGQFDDSTTRIVVELNPGYTLDPSQVKFRGATAQKWSVQLPAPTLDNRLPVPPPPGSSGPRPGSGDAIVPTQPPPGATPLPPRPGDASGVPRNVKTQVQSVTVTPDGLFLRTSGSAPRIQSSRSRDRQQIYFDLSDSAVAPGALRDMLVGRYGVNRIFITQQQASPAVVRVTLNVSPNSPDWQATASNLGGVVMVPVGGVTAATNDSTRPPVGGVATIESIRLDSTQLVVQSNQPLRFTTSWGVDGFYRVTIAGAKLGPNVRAPQAIASSPAQQVKVQTQGDAVVILIKPALGVRIGEPNQIGRQILAVSLERNRPIIPPSRPGAPPSTMPPVTGPLPRIPNGRVVVLIDPGHGGPDPGAVGIGGIREKDIVLDISTQVAAILRQQGVEAVMSRTADIDLDLEPRVDLADRVNAAIFVSIHANAIDMSRPDVNGLETYYYSSGEQLARTVHQTILQSLDIRDRRVRRANFYVLRNSSMPSILVETGFVTGAEDAANLASASHRSRMAQAIARGILIHLQGR